MGRRVKVCGAAIRIVYSEGSIDSAYVVIGSAVIPKIWSV